MPVANALELDLPSEDGQPARLGRGERPVLGWRDEAGAEEEAWLVTVSANGQRVVCAAFRHVDAVAPRRRRSRGRGRCEWTRKERLEKLGAEPEPEPEPGR